jgi:acyl-CoA synthetase (NDP forming)
MQFRTLSEFDSLRLVAWTGARVVDERLVRTEGEAVTAATELGYPVVAKLCGPAITHKTERGLVLLGLASSDAVARAFRTLMDRSAEDDGPVDVLIAPMVAGRRELICGITQDPTFGPCAMVGFGGVFAEVIGDTVFRPLPISAADAHDMLDELSTQRLFAAVRGEPAVDRDAVARLLVAVSALGERPGIRSVDLNPVVLVGGQPVVVDALVELDDSAADAAGPVYEPVSTQALAALFDPRSVAVVGVSSHPAKFGFTTLHNVISQGFRGPVYPVKASGEPVLGLQTFTSVAAVPAGDLDLVVLCTPPDANETVLREAAAKGARSAYVISAGYRDAGAEGAALEHSLKDLAAELGMIIAGPNGQGFVSTPSSLCAQCVAPYPPAGPISIVSQSGNCTSSLMNYARSAGVGIARAISAGNASMVGVSDYLRYFGEDPATRVAIAYIEDVGDGRDFVAGITEAARQIPVVAVCGGVTPQGRRAATSHTGALATSERVTAGALRKAGAVIADSVEEAYETAATFATQPLPRGPRTVVVTTAGGWGVLTADAIGRSSLELLALPGELIAAVSELLPARWSHNNPIDLAGGETRDTLVRILELVTAHDDVDAVVYLGLGIQANMGEMLAAGPFYPDPGLDRIVDFHRRQEERFAQAAAAVSRQSGKPVLTVTELATMRPDNPGVAAVRGSGRLCYPSATRAVRCLEHMWTYRRWLSRQDIPLELSAAQPPMASLSMTTATA